MSSRIGFDFVPFPRDIWDKNIQLTLGEFRLFGYLLRHQLRFRVTQPVRITDDEMMYGRKKKDGSRIDQGCGITGPNSLKDARQRLLEKRWIRVDEDLSDPARPKRWYLVEVSDSDTQLSETDTSLSETDALLSDSDTRSDSREIIVERFRRETASPLSQNGGIGSDRTEVGSEETEGKVTQNRKESRAFSPQKTKAEIPPLITLVRIVTKRFPPKDLWEELIRVLEGKSEEQIRSAYIAWRKRNFSPLNYGWTEWVETGIIPLPNGKSIQLPLNLSTPCALCIGQTREKHWSGFDSEAALKDHFRAHLSVEEAEQRFLELRSWWRTQQNLKLREAS